GVDQLGGVVDETAGWATAPRRCEITGHIKDAMRPGVEGGAHVEGLRVLRSTPLGEHGGELPAEGEGRGRQDHRGLGEEPLPQQVSDGKWCDADDLTVAVSREPDDVFPEQILLIRGGIGGGSLEDANAAIV